jgi:hypothetical protein
MNDMGKKKEAKKEAEKPDRLSGTSVPIRPRSAETIKASGHVRSHRKVGHMTASD